MESAFMLWSVFVWSICGVAMSVGLIAVTISLMFPDEDLTERILGISIMCVCCAPGLLGIYGIVYSAPRLWGML